jgi:small-conductance mechanosensitive channel
MNSLFSNFWSPRARGLSLWQIAAYDVIGVLLILLIGWILWRISSRLMRGFEAQAAARIGDAGGRKRIETVSRVLNYVASLVIAVVTFMTVLAKLGISIAPLLATAGVAGVAVGFGAQTLVKDYFAGMVLLIEDQIRQGDQVEVAGKTGVVEELTLRYVRLRDQEGAVHFVPNGAITTVTNRTR